MDIEDTAKGLIDPASITNQVEAALLRLQPEARAAFAALCAQRLMAWHVRLPAPEQRPYTLTWAPVLETIWTGLGKAVNLDEKAEVRKHLKDFYEVYNQRSG
jgi:hypothetical protein